MKIGNIIKICKKHGATEHGIYSYDGVESSRCLECVREATVARRQNEELRKHDLKYTKKWSEENTDHLRELREKLVLKKQEEKQKEINSFLKDKKRKIKKAIELCENQTGISFLSFRDIQKRCFRSNITSMGEIKKLILTKTANKLYDREAYKQSTLVKYHEGVRLTYGSISPQEKLRIQNKYKKIAKKIVDEKIANVVL